MNLMRTILLSFIAFLFVNSAFGQKPDSVWTFDKDSSFSNTNQAETYFDSDENAYVALKVRAGQNFDVQFGPGVTQIAGDVSRIIKYNADFELLWVKNFNKIFDIHVSKVIGNRLYLSGIFKDSVDFDPDVNQQAIRVSMNKNSFFLLELDTSGIFRRVLILEGAKNVLFTNFGRLGLEINPDKSMFIHALLEDSIDTDPGPGKIIVGSPSGMFFTPNSSLMLKVDSNFTYLKHIELINDSFLFDFSFVDGKIIANGTQTRALRPDIAKPNLILPYNPQREWLFIEYDKNLNYLKHTYPFSGSGFRHSRPIISAPDGSKLLCGTFRGQIWLDSINATPDFEAIGKLDALVIKINDLQEFRPLATFHVGKYGFASPSFVGFLNGDDPLFEIFIGDELGSAPSPDFDPGPDTVLVDQVDGFANALVRLDKDLNFRWAGSLAREAYTYLNSMLVKNDSTFFVMGQVDYDSYIDLDMSWGVEKFERKVPVNRDVFATYTFPSPRIFPAQDEICQGDSLKFNDNYLKTNGVYTSTLLGSNYGDSVVELDLTVHPVYLNILQEDTLCFGELVQWRNRTLTESGIYYDSLKTVQGCDSIFQVIMPFSKVDTTLKQVNNLLIAAQFQKKYTWVDCYTNYTPIPNITVNAYTPPRGGIYAVIVENPFGCVDTSRCVEIRYVGMEDPALFSDLRVYPNPFSDVLHIEGLQPGATLRLVNTLGMEMLYLLSTDTTIDLQLGELPSGIYFLEIGMAGRKQRVKVVRGLL